MRKFLQSIFSGLYGLFEDPFAAFSLSLLLHFGFLMGFLFQTVRRPAESSPPRTGQDVQKMMMSLEKKTSPKAAAAKFTTPPPEGEKEKAYGKRLKKRFNEPKEESKPKQEETSKPAPEQKKKAEETPVSEQTTHEQLDRFRTKEQDPGRSTSRSETRKRSRFKVVKKEGEQREDIVKRTDSEKETNTSRKGIEDSRKERGSEIPSRFRVIRSREKKTEGPKSARELKQNNKGQEKKGKKSTARKGKKKSKTSSEDRSNSKSTAKKSQDSGEQKNGSGRKLSKWERILQNIEKNTKEGAVNWKQVQTGQENEKKKPSGKKLTYYEKLSKYLTHFYDPPVIDTDVQRRDPVVLRVKVMKDGTLKIAKELQVSSYPEMNRAARKTISKAKSFQKPPLGNTRASSMTVRITFPFRTVERD